MSLIYIGLDGEMTSSELELGGKLCQIGVADIDGDVFCETIGWDPGSYYAMERSMAVHKISVETINKADRAEVVDSKLVEWLSAKGADPETRGRVIPIGWNVGAFDLPFVKDALPSTTQLLSRRTIDLNSLVMSMAESGLVYNGSKPKWSGWKRLSKQAAEERLAKEGREPQHHNAGYDAVLAIYAWQWLCEQMKSNK